MMCRGLYCDLYFVLMLLWKWWLWSCVYYCFIIIYIFFYKLIFTTREMLVIQWEKFFNRPSRWQSCIFIALFVQLAFLEGKKKKIQGGIIYYLSLIMFMYINIYVYFFDSFCICQHPCLSFQGQTYLRWRERTV